MDTVMYNTISCINIHATFKNNLMNNIYFKEYIKHFTFY